MPRAFTSLSDLQITKIKESGVSIYQFVQDAVAEKIKNDQEKKEVNQYELILKNILKDLKEDINKSLMKTIEVQITERKNVERKVDEIIEHHEKTKRVTNNVLNEIRDRLGGQK